jgi:hypothetical protein
MPCLGGFFVSEASVCTAVQLGDAFGHDVLAVLARRRSSTVGSLYQLLGSRNPTGCFVWSGRGVARRTVTTTSAPASLGRLQCQPLEMRPPCVLDALGPFRWGKNPVRIDLALEIRVTGRASRCGSGAAVRLVSPSSIGGNLRFERCERWYFGHDSLRPFGHF